MRLSVLLLAAGILAPALSGCFGAPIPWSATHYEVRATDPGLFAALRNATPPGWILAPNGPPANVTLDRVMGPHIFAELLGPDTGLPWPAHEIPDACGSGARICLAGLEQRDVQLILAEGVPDAAVTPWAERFLENATTMDRGARHAWAQQFAGSGYKGEGLRHLRLDAPLDLDRLWRHLHPKMSNLTDQGSVHADGMGWTIWFDPVPLTLARGNESLWVDRDDTVHYRGPWTPGLNQTRALADFANAYRSLGRPVPTNARFLYVGPVL